jgi:Ni,Fe-hydrogenase I small subunit
MVRVTRRDFLKYCAMSAGALGLSASTLMRLESVLAKPTDLAAGVPPVLWLAGAACTGCTMSLLNEIFYTSIDDILLNKIDLRFIDTAQAAAGSYVNGTKAAVANSLDAAQELYNSDTPFVLVVEGAIQTATPSGSAVAGDYCKVGDLTGTTVETMYQNAQLFADKAAAILAVGACSSWGGVPGAKGNVTSAKGVGFTGTSYGGAIIGTGNHVSGVSIKNYGWGYTAAPTVTFEPDGTGTKAIDATVNMQTGVTSLSYTTAATYDLRPNVVFDNTGTGGSGASAMAIINNWDGTSCNDSAYCDPSKAPGELLDVRITCYGEGYTTAPTVTVESVIGDPNPVATFNVTAGLSMYVESITINNPDVNGPFDSAPAVQIAKSPATGTTAPGNQESPDAEAAALLHLGGTVNDMKHRTGLAAKLINISGCPPHPDWIIGTLAYVLDYLPAYVQGNIPVSQIIPPLDRYYRPIDFGYATYQCNAGPCPWRYNNANNVGTTTRTLEAYEYNRRYPQGNSRALGINKYQGDDVGCLGILGCKGRKTKADCSARRWNADGLEQYGVNWCVGSRAGCHGCTEPTFPDKVGKFFTFA